MIEEFGVQSLVCTRKTMFCMYVSYRGEILHNAFSDFAKSNVVQCVYTDFVFLESLLYKCYSEGISSLIFS